MGSNRFNPSHENIFKEGDVVYAKAYPTLSLVVRRYVHRIYYCRREDDPEGKEHVYFERELIQAR